MDLSQFKVESETPENYHISHPNGKKFSLDKKGLSPKMHDKIKKMCMGGVAKMADGGQVKPDPASSVAGATVKAASGADITNPKTWWAKGGMVQKLADGDGDVQPIQPGYMANPDMMGSGTVPAPSQGVQAPQIQLSPDQQEQTAAIAPSQAAPATPQPGAKPMGTDQEQKVSGEQNAYEKEKAANLAGARAIGGEGMAESKAIDDYNTKMGKLPSQQTLIDQNEMADAALEKQYRDKKIDPDRYWHSQGTGSKIAAGIGMLLSGFGGGAAKQAPMAQQIIADSINRDIDAQKNDQSKAMNLWKMNREALGTDLGANLATQNQLLNGVKMKLNQAASQFKGPIALAAAQAGNAKIDQEMNMNRIKLSMMGGPTQENPDPATRVQWLVPKEHQAKVFDEIDAAKATAQNAPKILEAFDNAAKNLHAADFVPGMDNADQKAIHALMGPTFKDVEGTVRQAAMDNMAHNTTPQFGDDANTVKTKRNALIGYLTSKQSAATGKGYGIDLSRFPSTSVNALEKSNQQSQNPLEGKTATNAQGQKIMNRGGKWVPVGQ